jgi:pimeloyl-ACP methyl ester carboxylesterase
LRNDFLKCKLQRAFIDFLMEATGVPLSAFHIFGHSAGAHVAGAIGLGFRERHNFNEILPRVTGY